MYTERCEAALPSLLSERLYGVPPRRVTGIWANARSFGDGDAACVSCCPHLESLLISDTAVSDVFLGSIPPLNAVRWMSLDNTRVTDAGIRQLAKHKRLRVLMLSGTGVTNDGFEFICSSLPELQVIDVSSTAVSDEAICRVQARYSSLGVIK